MTLDTRIVIHENTDAKELHTWINKNLLRAPDAIFTEDEHNINNTPGQGLAAWLMMEHNNGDLIERQDTNYSHEDAVKEAMRWADSIEDAEESVKEDEEYYAEHPQGHIELSFDTAYGYQGPGNIGCTALHTYYIIKLATEYFEPRGLTFSWQNEYSGEWAEGLDDAALNKFLRSGDDAMKWFQSVIPVIEKAVEEGEI